MERQEQSDEDIAKSELELPKVNPIWLAGIFEEGGTIDFRITSQTWNNRKIYTASPSLVFNDNDILRLQALQKLVGGNIHNIKNAGYRWSLTGKKTLDIIEGIKPYAPSRQEVITAVENWQHTQDREERVQIARDMLGRDRVQDVTVDNYIALIRNIDFVAGVIDSRGFIKYKSLLDQTKSFRSISTRSTNLPLLDALSTEHGGIVRQSSDNKNKYYQWEVGADNARTLLQSLSPHLLMRQTF